MFVGESFSFLDIFRGENFAGKIRFQDVLEPGNFGVIEEAAARANV